MKRKLHFEETDQPDEYIQTPSKHFEINNFLPIIDKLLRKY